ncbi:outer membrane protein [Kaarinaea lacus]
MLNAAPAVYALDLDLRHSTSELIDFSFLINSSTIEFTDSDTVVDTDITRFGVLSYHVPSSGPHFGFALGYSYGDLSNHPTFQSIDMDGWYVGILVRGMAYESERMAISLEAQYTYQDLSGADTTRTASLSWNEYSVNATLHVALTKALRIYAAPLYGGVDATYQYQVQGTAGQSDKLEANNNAGFLAGLRYKLDKRDFVSLEYHDYTFTGAVLGFRRLF